MIGAFAPLVFDLPHPCPFLSGSWQRRDATAGYDKRHAAEAKEAGRKIKLLTAKGECPSVTAKEAEAFIAKANELEELKRRKQEESRFQAAAHLALDAARPAAALALRSACVSLGVLVISVLPVLYFIRSD